MTDSTSSNYDFLVSKADLASNILNEVVSREIADGEALLSVDRFAITANNITYGVAGDMIGYWQFFPADEPFGRIPVWGIGTVQESKAQGKFNNQILQIGSQNPKAPRWQKMNKPNGK